MQSNSLLIATLFFLNLTAFQAQNSLVFSPTNPSVRQGITEKFRASNTTVADISSIYGALIQDDPMLKISVEGRQMEFMLYENSLISKDYFVTVASNDKTKILKDLSVRTYDGVLKGSSGHITITIDHDYFVAMIKLGGEEYFIEQATAFDRNATSEDLIFYNSKDVIHDATKTCASDDLINAAPEVDGIEERFVNLCSVVEIAIASDASMFDKYSSSITAVQNHNIAVMNNVAFNYLHEFSDNITFQIVTQYVSTTFNNDPLSPNTISTAINTVYDAFATWSLAGGFGVVHDLGTFWTNRDFDGSTIGLAGVAAMCTGNRFSVLQDFTPDAAGLRSLMAHEVGHNFGAGHDTIGAPFIMAPSVNGSNKWSALSVTNINAHLLTRACLSNCTGPISASFIANPTALCNNGTVQFEDKSTNSNARTWTFTSGSPSTSTAQKPNVTYSSTGTFSATIVANGTSTYSLTNAVIVSPPPPLATGSCPLPTGTPGSGGIQGVSLADMYSASGTAAADGNRYVDRSCTNIASLQANTSYVINIGLGNCSMPLYESVRMYIDYNNNGVFAVSEEIALDPNAAVCGFYPFSFSTPPTPVKNALLRMRIISNNYTIGITGPCYNPSDGQVEDFSVIFKAAVPLPLDLISFTGKYNKGYNDLNWATKNESKIKHFTLERSRDGKDFIPIGYVTPLNNSLGGNYTFKDDDLKGSNGWYYRLRMEDVSAAFAYSQVIFLNNKGVNLSMENLVTVNTSDRPISFRLTSSSNQMVTIELFDMMGKLQSNYTTQINEGQNNMEFNTDNILKGMYILLVKNNIGEELVNKIFIE